MNCKVLRRYTPNINLTKLKRINTFSFLVKITGSAASSGCLAEGTECFARGVSLGSCCSGLMCQHIDGRDFTTNWFNPIFSHFHVKLWKISDKAVCQAATTMETTTMAATITNTSCINANGSLFCGAWRFLWSLWWRRCTNVCHLILSFSRNEL